MLSEKELMCGCKILEELNITQGTLSHHMKLLVDNKFVNCKKDGKWCFYSINKNTLLNIADYLKNI